MCQLQWVLASSSDLPLQLLLPEYVHFYQDHINRVQHSFRRESSSVIFVARGHHLTVPGGEGHGDGGCVGVWYVREGQVPVDESK